MYDGIDRSELKDVVSIIKGEADDNEDEDVEEDKVVGESDMKTNGKKSAMGNGNTPVDLQDSNENNNRKKKDKSKKVKKSPKAVVSDDKETEAKGIEAINMKVLPNLVAPVEPITEPVESKDKTPVVLNIRDRNATAHSLTISEAFADDDVIEEFRAEKVTFIN